LSPTFSASALTAQRAYTLGDRRHPTGKQVRNLRVGSGRSLSDRTCRRRRLVDERRDPPLPTKECEVTTTSLTRPQQGRVIAGVCAGLAQRYGWNANVVRLLFLLSCLLPGPQFVIYLVLWALIPKAPY
jgi:phage shock protein C